MRSSYGRLDVREDSAFMRGVRAEMMERMGREEARDRPWHAQPPLADRSRPD